MRSYIILQQINHMESNQFYNNMGRKMPPSAERREGTLYGGGSSQQEILKQNSFVEFGFSM